MNKIAKDMSKVYRNSSTMDLIKNRRRKAYQLLQMKHETSYWAKKEQTRLVHMIDQIDAELDERALLQPLF